MAGSRYVGYKSRWGIKRDSETSREPHRKIGGFFILWRILLVAGNMSLNHGTGVRFSDALPRKVLKVGGSSNGRILGLHPRDASSTLALSTKV